MASPPVADRARARGLRLVQPDRTHDPEMLLLYRELGVDTIVVAAFGQMIREPLLSEMLMVNVHGSCLPEYRGAAPVERAIMDGRAETGVDIMQMEAGLDTGPVAFEARVPIGPHDDAGMVYDALASAAIPLLHRALDDAEAGTLTWTPQPVEGATYAHKITAGDRELDVATLTARQVHDRVRGLSPHIGAWCSLGGQRLTLWHTRVVELPAGAVAGDVRVDSATMVIACADGAVEVVEAQPAGKRRMPIGDWLRGVRDLPGRVDAPTPHHASDA